MYRALNSLVTVTAAVMFLSPTAAISAAEWGSIKGRFLVDGVAPKPAPLIVTKDQFCIDKKPMNESVVVGDDGGLANAVVYVRLARGDKIDVHPDYAAALSKPIELDNKGCHFVPHVTLVRAGQPLILKNSDPVGHNTNVGVFNQIIPSGGQTQTKIDREAALPIPVSCNIHPFMKGYVLVQNHPYMAVSAEDGTFEIANIPAGKHEFAFWHESPGYMQNLKLAGATTDRRGRAELTIAAGKPLDLGTIKMPASSLKAGR
ncbi:MAG: hypothetical protein WD468_06425 [Pirellulales bacterium]